MTRITLTVNGKQVTRDVEPRTNLADFLREDLLLTGTHVGCEHGICGACTVVVDGEISRSCITYAVTCDGANVRTIEDFDDEPLMQRLRRAFSEEHALQCGYCTPGMLMAARDLVRRHGGLDEHDIRLALSGNLCRCTGYMGIVRAVEKVMAEGAGVEAGTTTSASLGPAPGPEAPDSLAAGAPQAVPQPRTMPREAEPVLPQSSGAANVTIGELRQEGEFTTLTQTITVGHAPDEVWRYLADIEKVAACMPGVTLDGPPQDGHVTGRFAVKLGPIHAAFAGEADVTRFDQDQRGVIEGRGRDARSASRAKGRVAYRLQATDGGSATRIEVTIAYALAGPLAQFSRGALVRDLVARIAGAFAQTLEARLSGREEEAAAPTRLDAGALVFAMLWDNISRAFARLFGRRGRTQPPR